MGLSSATMISMPVLKIFKWGTMYITFMTDEHTWWKKYTECNSASVTMVNIRSFKIFNQSVNGNLENIQRQYSTSRLWGRTVQALNRVYSDLVESPRDTPALQQALASEKISMEVLKVSNSTTVKDIFSLNTLSPKAITCEFCIAPLWEVWERQKHKDKNSTGG